MIEIEATYSDKAGEFKLVLINDDSHLKMRIDRVDFTSGFLDDFRPNTTEIDNDRFTFDKNGILTDFTLLVKLPVKFQEDGIEKETTLDCEIKSSLSESGYSKTTANGKVKFGDEIIEIPYFDMFEGLFNQLNQKLKPNTQINCCFNCLYSDYSVYGQGFWGTMLCFKNTKREYLKVKDKDEYMKMMDNYSWLVPETHICKEFKRRVPGTGYRG